MYINFEQLAASGLSAYDLINLLAIRQKDDIVVACIPKEDISKYIEIGFISELKNGGYKLSRKGTSFIEVMETPGINSDISETLDSLFELYEKYGKDIGVSRKEAQDRLSWFMGNTNFKKKLIVDIATEYVSSSGEYTMSLCNFIWKPPSQAFSVHKNLKNSKLFDLIAQRHGLNTDLYYKDKQNKEIEWLFAVSRLPNPPAKGDLDCLFTQDAKREKQRLLDIKKILFNRLKTINKK